MADEVESNSDKALNCNGRSNAHVTAGRADQPRVKHGRNDDAGGNQDERDNKNGINVAITSGLVHCLVWDLTFEHEIFDGGRMGDNAQVAVGHVVDGVVSAKE